MAARVHNKDDLIAALQARVDELESQHAAQREQLKQRDVRIAALEAKLASLKRTLFSRSSEKLSGEQLALWRSERHEEIAAVEAELTQLGVAPEVAQLTEPRHPRRPIKLPQRLPRRTEVLDVDGTCTDCGGALHKIGEECTQILEWVPGHAEVRELIRPKYACRGCETISIAALPARINDKGLLGESVAAQALVSKYDDHLPLHRQRKVWTRHGVDIPESTLGDVVGRSAFALTPICDRLAALVTQGGKLHVDDTPATVLVAENGRTVGKEGRFWVYHLDHAVHGPPIQPMVVFTFSPSRAGHYPQSFLKDFTGYLQADAFSGFNALYARGTVKEVACWAHARRKFEALQDAPIAREVLLRIGALYDIERAAKGLPLTEIEAQRKALAKPILDALKIYLDARLMEISNASELPAAIHYVTKRWASFCRYVDHGALCIDNNPAERLIRPIAVGRKNWNLLGSIGAGERAAVIYSLIGTCRLNGVEPWAYLSDVLTRLPTHPARDIDALLPMNWTPPPPAN